MPYTIHRCRNNHEIHIHYVSGGKTVKKITGVKCMECIKTVIKACMPT